jgi:alanine-synthesizing transaminase
MEFRRITNLPPYVFSIINGLKIEARQAGADVIDLGFGNPDIPSPNTAVEKLAEAARNPRNHRYSLSRGLPKLREAIAGYYEKTWGVELDPELEITNTIGSKEGFSHLMWVLLDQGDAAIVPSPSYPIHIYGPLFAGADLRQVPMRSLSDPRVQVDFEGDFFDSLKTAYDVGWPKPRVLVISFPHNPTGATVDLPFMQKVVDFCRERDMIVVHDFAYADMGFDGHQPPSILQAEGAKECAVELYSMTKSFSMAGWRVAFLLGNSEVVQALVKLKSYLDYGTFQPVQIAATVTINEQPDFPKEICATYQNRRDALIDGLGRIGWDIPKPKGSMFVWAPIPEAYAEMDSVAFCSHMVKECDVALSPGVGFGPGGEGFIRFALIENEQRIGQAVRNLKRGLTRLSG